MRNVLDWILGMMISGAIVWSILWIGAEIIGPVCCAPLAWYGSH